MSFTRAQLRTRAARRADAMGQGATISARWDSTAGSTGELDQLGGAVFDQEWRRILNANPYYRFGTRTPTSDSATGRYTLASLDSGSGDTAQRLYRILSVVIDNIPYEQSEFRDWSLGETLNLFARVWWQEGTSLMVLPKQLSKQATITVNWLPTRIDNLSGEGIAVDFPDGYEEVLVLEWAAAMLIKGGAESDAASVLKAEAEMRRADMLQDVARLSTNSRRMRYDDFAFEWGG